MPQDPRLFRFPSPEKDDSPRLGVPDTSVCHPQLAFNGINATVGGPYYRSFEPPSRRPAPGTAEIRLVEKVVARAEKRRSLLRAQERFSAGGPYGLDYRDLAQTGWGVIFAPGIDPAIPQALAPLLAWRREQASQRDPRYYREIHGEAVLDGDDSTLDFFLRHQVAPAWLDPASLPYYLLLVGDPDALPYTFQHDLDSQFAVGRLDLETPEAYARYAESVVASERECRTTPLRAAFFGARNPDDSTMAATCDCLVGPLAKATAAACNEAEVRLFTGEEATKTRLAALLGGGETPDLLFTGCHGVGFHSEDPRQAEHQGALLCQDWPGPEGWPWPCVEDHYFAGQDLAADARLGGLIHLSFACHSAGTPAWDFYLRGLGGEPRQIAARSFVAHLPRRLLGHPAGGALAVVGHVERTWGYSFLWTGSCGEPGPFHEATERLLSGYPVGFAMEPFARRYLALMDWLVAELNVLDEGRLKIDEDFAWLWTATQDARSYVIVGDPAVRLPGVVCAPVDPAATG